MQYMKLTSFDREEYLRNLEEMPSYIGSWKKEGALEGVGKITLCDMPSFITQHDAARKTEIEVWKEAFA
jgi:hypothetical protein